MLQLVLIQKTADQWSKQHLRLFCDFDLGYFKYFVVSGASSLYFNISVAKNVTRTESFPQIPYFQY